MRAIWICIVLGWTAIAPTIASAEQAVVQNVPCEPGPERRLTPDGAISDCRLADAANLLPGPLGGIWHNMDEVSGSSAPSLRFAARGLMAYAFVCTAPNQQVEIYNILTTA